MPQDGKPSGETLPEEIRELERLLEEKKRVLAEKGEEREPREVFREVFREKYPLPTAEKIAPPPVGALPEPPSGTTQKREDDAIKKEREEEIAALIEISFEQGVRQAVDIAKRTSPWLLDELHDRLTDEYYQKLVQSREVKESA